MALDGHLDVTPGDAVVEFAFAVTNTGSDPVDLQFRSGKVADVAVYEEGVEIWRWSEGLMFTQAVETETLSPGEVVTHEATWESPRPGGYVAEASLAATSATLVERVAFEI